VPDIPFLGTALDWALRAVLLAFGAGSLIALSRWMVQAMRERRERWAIRLAIGMLVLAAVYGIGHARLLWNAEQIEAGRMAWRRFGDPREAERSRGEVRGWIMDCTGEPANALARYGVRDGEVQRVYALGEAGANLVGGGTGAEDRDYTVERLFARQLREPRSLRERSELHPVGTDMQLTLCANPTRQAWSLLTATGLNGTVIIQDVKTGGVVSYVATGRAEDPPFGIKHYAPPGSVFKLAFSAIWWDHGLPETRGPCPPYVQVGNARIRNFESHEYASLTIPTGMLTVSCNTAAVNMVFALRNQLGVETIRDDLQKFGFVTYSGKPPAAPRDFWNTASDAWTQRMTPPPVRVRFLAKLTPHELGQIAIGQGPVDATPMGISRFIQAIGNDGVMMQPTLESARLGEGAEGRRIMKQTTSAKLQHAMRTVVDTGTAQVAKAIIARTGWDLGGKTGTADVAGARMPDAWFAGLMFGPDGRARYSVVVYLQHGGQGGRMPARIAAEMTRFMAREAGTPVQPARQASASTRTGRGG
jgi:hypothetical protein